jgi:RNA polymerase sigma-70 factor (ECF subfamily)
MTMPKVPFTIDNKFLADVREAVLQYAYKRFGLSGLDIEDLVQEALMTMFDNVQSGKLTGLTCNLKTYVIGILKNIASMKLREMKPFVGDINQSDDEDTVDPVDLEVAKAALRRWQENDGETELKENTVHDIVINMTDPCKTILWSYYWEGKSMRDIAEIMDYKNADVAKSKKSLCMTKVKAALEETFKRMRL